MRFIPNRYSYLIGIILLLSFSFCYASQDGEYTYHYKVEGRCGEEVYDPYEKLNRKIFAFNSVLDHIILRPVAIGYKKVTNDYTKARVDSFLSNVSEPLTSVNYVIQMKIKNSIRSFWRFMLNSTVGIGGIFDVAGKFGIHTTPQTLGSTFARYGVGPGPYIILPFFGPTNARDFTDILLTNNRLNPLKYALHSDFKLILTGTNMVNNRSSLLPFTDYVAEHSTDPYISIRTASHQSKEHKIKYPKGFKCPVAPELTTQREEKE